MKRRDKRRQRREERAERRDERRERRESIALGLRIPRFAWDSAHPQWPHCVARAVGAQGYRMREGDVGWLGHCGCAVLCL